MPQIGCRSTCLRPVGFSEPASQVALDVCLCIPLRLTVPNGQHPYPDRIVGNRGLIQVPTGCQLCLGSPWYVDR